MLSGVTVIASGHQSSYHWPDSRRDGAQENEPSLNTLLQTTNSVRRQSPRCEYSATFWLE
jgi:hypothetical protein